MKRCYNTCSPKIDGVIIHTKLLLILLLQIIIIIIIAILIITKAIVQHFGKIHVCLNEKTETTLMFVM